MCNNYDQLESKKAARDNGWIGQRGFFIYAQTMRIYAQTNSPMARLACRKAWS
jgi:hypothetical protein